MPQPATEPSQTVVEWIGSINYADPSSAFFNEGDEFDNNNGPQWGHYQFTAGGFGIKRTLTSREAVGSCTTALQLLAAFLRTAKIARFVCEQKSISTSSYLADAYTQELVNHLLTLWVPAQPEQVCLSSCLLPSLISPISSRLQIPKRHWEMQTPPTRNYVIVSSRCVSFSPSRHAKLIWGE